jgi:hypothetical protein
MARGVRKLLATDRPEAKARMDDVAASDYRVRVRIFN